MIFPSLPIWQAATGSVAGPELCAAVARAGGMGGMGLTWATPADAAEAVASIPEGVFQGNFVLAFPPLALPAALEAGLRVVTFSWGDPEPYLDLCRAHGATVGVQVGNLAGARAQCDQVDFLIVQGVEAGGHVQSTTALFDLLPRVVDLGRPTVAAGGLAVGKDIRRALDLGAVGAMLGTRFVATRESRAHPEYKARLVEARETALTALFDGGWANAPHRVLRNTTLEAWEAAGCPSPPNRPGEGDVLGAGPGGPIHRYDDVAPRDGFTGTIEAMCLYAGAGAVRIEDLPPAGDLVRRLAAEAGLTCP